MIKKLYPSILLGFPLKLILWFFYDPFEVIDPIVDSFISAGLFLVWIAVMLDYEDTNIAHPSKRLNLISFLLMIVIIFTSPQLKELGEKIAYYSHPLKKIDTAT